MKNSLFLLALFASLSAHSQVGINTSLAGSTLDVTAKNTTGTSTNVDGLLVPRVDRQRAQSMTSVPTSTMIYVNNIATGTQTGTTTNVDAVGYYYFDGSAWVKLHNPANSTFSSLNIYNTDGSLTGNRLVQQNANTLAFTGTAANAFSVDGSTLSVNAANDRVGIGTTAPGVKLDVAQSIGTSEVTQLRILNTSPVAANNTAYIGFNSYNAGGASWGIGSIQNSTTPTDNNFHILYSSGGAYGKFFTIRPNTGFVGIGTTTPTNMLHVNGTNPLRLEGLQTSSGKVGTLVVNSTGVVQTQTSTDISAVRVTGSLTLSTNNTETLTNSGNTPTEAFDNLNEFSGATFTAAAAGLYKIDFSINFDQRTSSNDNGDGYMGYALIYLNGTSYSQAAVKVANPEISGTPSYQTAATSALVKMAAGSTLKFYATNYGSSGGNTSDYTINIVRID